MSIFPFDQLVYYISSCLWMLSYAVCWLFFVLVTYERWLYIHLSFEIFLVLIRGLNEITYKTFNFRDVLHHSSFIISVIICCRFPSCTKYLWLSSHMQVLHIPTSFWYLGCRRGSSLVRDKIVKKVIQDLFPPLWLLSVGYRASMTTLASISSLYSDIFLQRCAVIIFAFIFLRLDVLWTKYFLCQFITFSVLLNLVSASS